MTRYNQSSRTDDMVARAYDAYSETVYRIAFASTRNIYDAEDITQEVFMRYIKKVPLFESPEHEKAWFIRVALNCTKNLFRSAWFRKSVAYDEVGKDTATYMSEKSEVFHAVADLPETMRMCIHLYYYEDRSIAEVAKLLGKSQSAIKSTLMRARQLLAKKLQEDERMLFGDE